MQRLAGIGIGKMRPSSLGVQERREVYSEGVKTLIWENNTEKKIVPATPREGLRALDLELSVIYLCGKMVLSGSASWQSSQSMRLRASGSLGLSPLPWQPRH